MKLNLITRLERLFVWALKAMGVIMPLLLFGVVITLGFSAWPTIKLFGLKFFVTSDWDPITHQFGAMPFIVGTLLTSFLALLISAPFSLAIALLLSEYLRRGILGHVMTSMIELLAGIPSVVYGFWGLMVLVPFIRNLQIMAQIPPFGVGIFTAAIILGIMIIPYSASITREVMLMVPKDIKEASQSLGATRFETVRKIILPYAKSGIFAGVLLALGRALGETMAVTMVIGNANRLPDSIFSPGNTLASVIANEFAEASDLMHRSSLVELGLVLILITLIVNYIGRVIINRTRIETAK